jgi:arginyl-tRNA synthetase
MFVSQVKKIINSVLPTQIEFALEIPPKSEFGDLACNVALLLAKNLKKSPHKIAKEITDKLVQNEFVQKIEIAGPGFLNIFLTQKFFYETLLKIEKLGDNFGMINLGKKEKILLEFISANPTGPLTIANGRGGFGGDTLARVLKFAGFTVTREFYVNDAGNQIKLLGKSIEIINCPTDNKSDDLYQGKYIQNLAKKFPTKITKNDFETGRNFAQILLETEIKPVIKQMGINFDHWQSEFELRESGGMEKIFTFLKNKNLTYEKDGAVWLKTSQFGDDKNRVIRKSQKNGGGSTYILPDLMYHQNKFERGFTRLIDILGADHHGYVPRLKLGVKMLGFGEVEVIIAQLVKLFRDKKEVRMSKRTGNFESMRDLLDEVGVDAARWFFISRDWNTHLNFDLDLAKKQSAENPVFYVQYAHTRLASIMQKAAEQGLNWQQADLSLLQTREEFKLIQKMAELPDLVNLIANNFEVHRLTFFARELAEIFHQFYEKCRVLDSESTKLSAARLRLVVNLKMVLRIVLVDLIGVSAPEKM